MRFMKNCSINFILESFIKNQAFYVVHLSERNQQIYQGGSWNNLFDKIEISIGKPNRLPQPHASNADLELERA